MDIKVFPTLTIPSKEIKWKFSKSKGPGGQKINKTHSKVQLIFNIRKSKVFSDVQKNKIINNLNNKLVNDSIFITVRSERQQHKNRELAVEKMILTIKKCPIIENKIRRSTKPTITSIKKRIASKKLRGELKKYRKYYIY